MRARTAASSATHPETPGAQILRVVRELFDRQPGHKGTHNLSLVLNKEFVLPAAQGPIVITAGSEVTFFASPHTTTGDDTCCTFFDYSAEKQTTVHVNGAVVIKSIKTPTRPRQ